MREQKFHLRDWIHWDSPRGVMRGEMKTLCGILVSVAELPAQVKSASQESEELMKMENFSEKICKNCWNSYISTISQEKRNKILESKVA